MRFIWLFSFISYILADTINYILPSKDTLHNNSIKVNYKIIRDQGLFIPNCTITLYTTNDLNFKFNVLNRVIPQTQNTSDTEVDFNLQGNTQDNSTGYYSLETYCVGDYNQLTVGNTTLTYTKPFYYTNVITFNIDLQNNTNTTDPTNNVDQSNSTFKILPSFLVIIFFYLLFL